MPTARPATADHHREADLVERRVEVEVERRIDERQVALADGDERGHDVAVEQTRARRRSHTTTTATMIAIAAPCVPSNPAPQRLRCRPASVDRSQPSLEPLRQDEHADTDQDHEADRRVGAGKIVALGQLVDELAEPAEIDQKLDTDDVDSAKISPSRTSDEDRRQRRRKQNLPEPAARA